jgi:hypothetical protein
VERHYKGKHNLGFASDRFRQAFGGLFKDFADNWCEVVCDAPAERLTPVGFRFGTGDETDPPAADRMLNASGSPPTWTPGRAWPTPKPP